MSWTLQSSTKTSLLTACTDADTAIASLATAVTEMKAALLTAQGEIGTQDPAHLPDVMISWGRFVDSVRAAMHTAGLTPIVNKGAYTATGTLEPQCSSVHDLFNSLLSGH